MRDVITPKERILSFSNVDLGKKVKKIIGIVREWCPRALTVNCSPQGQILDTDPLAETLDVARHAADLLLELAHLALERLVAAAQLVPLAPVALVGRRQLADLALQAVQAAARRLAIETTPVVTS